MKKGFTLAELMIVLGITGVVAAVLLPAINNLMPDKTKIMYLKAYDELQQNIQSLASNSSIYPIALNSNGENFNVSGIPLINNMQPIKQPFKDDTKYSGSSKLCSLIAYTMNTKDDKCSETSFPQNPSFSTQNGMRWWIVETKNEVKSAEKKALYQTDIYVDVDPSKKSGNCMWGDSNCKQPDIFKFLLAADGTLVAADPLGRKFIETRKVWLKKKYEVGGDVLAGLDETLLGNQIKEIVEPKLPDDDIKEDNNTGDENKDDEDEGSNKKIMLTFTMYEYSTPWSVGCYYYVEASEPVPSNVKLSVAVGANGGSFGCSLPNCNIMQGQTSCKGELPSNATDNGITNRYYDFMVVRYNAEEQDLYDARLVEGNLPIQVKSCFYCDTSFKKDMWNDLSEGW